MTYKNYFLCWILNLRSTHHKKQKMFSPIPRTNTNNSGRTTPSSIATSGRTTHTAAASSVESAISDRVTSTLRRSSSCEVVDAEELSGKKAGARNTGREKGAAAYAAGEHVALLSIMREVPKSFNSSESSPQ
jgi:hypothetical protein